MKREILIAVAGLTPQVVTETLYYLTQIKKPRSAISEIYVITTLDGKREILSKLLDEESGKFSQLCRDYGIDSSSIKFDESSIVLLRDSKGTPLADIRSARDNETAADRITEFIRELAGDEDTILHCSIAGGRKTMSVYLAYAMMLFGRRQDTLSHVLVDEEAERDRAFFYPPKSAKAAVHLAEIPYVRLRDKLARLFDDSDNLSFGKMVAAAQREIDSMPRLDALCVDFKGRCLVIGAREVRLEPKHLALYAHYCERRRTLPEDAAFEPLKGKGSVGGCADEIKNHILSMLPNTDVQKYSFAADNIRQDISKINNSIDAALGDSALAIHYKIAPLHFKRAYGATRYGIHLDPSRIKPPVLP
ncbi:MAG: CRISPR-associated ring nuclease Csm6 [Deltaproteobacteria bacterium]